MPRDPPVTSATLPSREQKAPFSGSGKRLLELAQRVGVAYGECLQRAIAAAEQAAEHLARTDLDEDADAVAHERAHRLRELDRSGELLDEQARDPLGILDLCTHRRHEGRRRVAPTDPLEHGTRLVGGARDERTVKGPAHS